MPQLHNFVIVNVLWNLEILCRLSHKYGDINYSDAMMSAMASQITGVLSADSTVCSGANQRKHQSSASLAFVRGIQQGATGEPPHKGSVTRKMFPFDDVIMWDIPGNTIALEHHSSSFCDRAPNCPMMDLFLVIPSYCPSVHQCPTMALFFVTPSYCSSVHQRPTTALFRVFPSYCSSVHQRPTMALFHVFPSYCSSVYQCPTMALFHVFPSYCSSVHQCSTMALFFVVPSYCSSFHQYPTIALFHVIRSYCSSVHQFLYWISTLLSLLAFSLKILIFDPNNREW